MAKKNLLFLLVVIISCNKSGSNNSTSTGGNKAYDAMVSYTASAQTTNWNDSSKQYVVDSIQGQSECFLNNFPLTSDTLFSGNVYEFDFFQNTAVNSGINAYGLTFIIPAQNYPGFTFPLNTPILFDFNTSYYKFFLMNSVIIFSLSEAFTGLDSVSINLVITRNSKGTIDGTFSALYYAGIPNLSQPTGIGLVTSGVFTNVPLKSN